jgi:cytochrome b6-f complex iron-sulfur subunit
MSESMAGGAGCGGCDGDERTHATEAVDRRSFLVQGAVSAALLALAACSVDATAPSSGQSIGSSITVADYPELANTGGVLLAGLSGRPIAVVRTGAASFLALSRVCPHQGGTIGTSGSGFVCPVHGARYDSTGHWIGGQRTTDMRTYSTVYDVSTDTLTIG